MSPLFEPFTLRSVVLPNRIVVSPMCQYVADEGRATAWHLSHLGQLAVSGAGLLFTEATAVEAAGRITPGDLGLWDDVTEAALEPVFAAVRAFSDIPFFMQLGHAGRKGSSATPWEGGQLIAAADGGWETSAASALPQKPGEAAPLELDDAGLARVRQAFVDTARRAIRLGVDGLELHGAHGYLLHEFLSPISNQRSDVYGGSLENRLRYPLEVFDAVRAAMPDDMPLGVKISATDWVDGVWDLAQSIAFAHELARRGVDWITASSGGISPLQKIVPAANYQVPFASAIKEATGVRTFAVGLITEPAQAEAIVANGEADCVALARAMLYDPRWPWHAAAALGATVSTAPSYWRAPPHHYKELFGPTVGGAR